MERLQKEQVISDIKDSFVSASTVIIAHYRGLTVSEITELRTNARKNGASVKVTKNTLARRAANDTKFEILSNMFAGPTAMVFSEDAVAAAKVVADFAKDNDKLVIIGGAINGETLDVAGVEALADTPSLDESRGKIVGLLTAPAARIASILQAPAGQVARVIGAHSSQ